MTNIIHFINSSKNIKKSYLLQISLSIYPAESALFRSIAEYLFEKGKLLRCIEMFGRAMDCARDEMEWLHAASNRENARSNVFDAWHWRMLNDGKRNSKFAQAILSAIETLGKKPREERMRVLDIGCGTGIFSVVAAYSPISPECVAVERDLVMCSVARRCFRRNGSLARMVELHETDSKKLELDQFVWSPCDLLFTETLDCAIFGERIVETIIDAKKRLLNEDAIIIPSKAVVLFSLIESDYVARESAFECSWAPISLLSPCCYIRNQDSDQQQKSSRLHWTPPILPPAPYNCAYLDELPSCSSTSPAYRLLSDPIEGLLVDFDNMQQLQQINSDRMITQIVIRAKEAGVASAVCVWFKLQLYDQIELCTSPQEGLCWQQALFPFYPHIRVCAGDVLRFQVFIKDHALHVQPINCSSTYPASDLAFSRELLRAPSTLDLLSMHDSAICDFFNRTIRANQPLSQMLDCTDLLLSLDLDNERRPKIVSTQPAIRYIGRENAASLDKVICKPGGAILHWPFSAQGDLMDDYCASIIDLHIRSPGTFLIPNQIVLMGCLISSNQLIERSGLLIIANEQRTVYCGVDLTPMDEFRIGHFHELESRTLQFETLSEPTELVRMDFSKEASSDLGELTKLKHECHLLCTRPGRCDAILLWFRICSHPFAPGSSPPPSPSSDFPQLDLRSDTFSAKSSAIILPSPINLHTPADGSRNGLKAQYSLHHGTVLFHWVKEAIFL